MNSKKGPNQLKAGAILSYLSMGLGYLISIVYTPIMLRLLGQSEYGLYNLVASVVSYLGVLNFGFGSAYMRYYSKYKVKEDKEKIAVLNGMFLTIFIVMGVIASIAGIILALNTELIFGSELSSVELSRAKILMIILVINLAISFPNIVFSSHITANEKFIFQKVVQMIRIVANPFLVLPILLMGYGSVGMVVMTTILNLVVEALNIIFCMTKLKMEFSFKKFDFKLMKEMTVFSSFIFVNMIIDQINWNLDKFILGRFHGTVSVAVYGLAAQLNTYYKQLSTAVSNVFIPRVHRIVSKGNPDTELTHLFTRIGRIQFIVLSLIASGIVFFGRPFINFWAGSEYDGSYGVALLLILPITIPLIQNIGIEIQRAKNMHRFRSIVYFFIAVLNLIVTIPLSSRYGAIGAATGTALSLLLGNGLLMNWYYHARVKLNIKYFWKQILSLTPALLIVIIFGILINNYLNLYNIVNFLVMGFIYVLIFFVSMWLLGMNDYEKDLIIKPLKKILHK